MNTSKITLAYVLSILAILVFSFICYLGFNFRSVGDLGSSIIQATITAILLSFTVFGATLLKQTNKHFKLSFIFEILLVAIFTVVIIGYAATSFSHYFAVSKNKVDIQNGINTTVSNAETMFKSYEEYVEERKNRYASRLESAVNNQFGFPDDFVNMGFLNNGIDLEQQRKEKLFMLNADLYPQNYNQIKAEYEKVIKNARSNVEVWKPMAVVSVVKHLDEKVPVWQNTLKDLSKHRAVGEIAEDFNIEIDVDSVKSKFNQNYSGLIITWLLALIAWGLMLFPYFLAKRDGKRLTSVEKYEVVL